MGLLDSLRGQFVDVIAVSYTHLDVYKRQAHDHVGKPGFVGQARAVAHELEADERLVVREGEADVVPVSYTHLEKSPCDRQRLEPVRALFRMGAFVDALSVSLYRF